MLLSQQPDLIEQSVRAAGLSAVTGIHVLDGCAGVPREPVVRTNLAEGVVDVRELFRGDLRERYLAAVQSA